MNDVRCFGFNVFSDSLSSILLNEPAKTLATISPNSYGISTKEIESRIALQKAEYLVLEGVNFALATILHNRRNIQKNQSPELFHHILNRLNNTKGKVYILDSTNEVPNKIKIWAIDEYPDIEFTSYTPLFKDEFDDLDEAAIITSVMST